MEYPVVLRSAVMLSLCLLILNSSFASLASAQTKSIRKLVVTMDSPLKTYDPENVGKRTNMDEILSILQPLEKQISAFKISTSLNWKGEPELRAKNPDLIIIHWSAFAAPPGQRPVEEDLKFISFLNYMADSKARFLIYTREGYVNEEAGHSALVRAWERQVPRLKGRLQIFKFIAGKPKRFRNPDVRQALRSTVSDILGIGGK
jgi:hypothetical protein